MLNDLRVRERHARHLNQENQGRSAETRHRYVLGVKLVAGSKSCQPDACQPDQVRGGF